MREIIFRGKRVDNGEWIEGDLLQIIYPSGKPTFCSIIEQTPVATNYAVIPETVGQFTGLTDKNGKRIFEGDIVKGNRNYIYIVKFGLHDIDCCGCCYISHQSVGFYLDFNDEGRIIAEEDSWEDLTVLGNIHDNPEILNDEREGR